MSLKHTLTLIFAISLAGSLMSLYFWYFGDPIMNFSTGDRWNVTNALTPCSLCRYARVMLYPMVIISGIWLLHRDRHSVRYLAPLALGGLAITWYQIALQAWAVADTWFCTIGSTSCAVIDWQYFGITIPMLACAAFVLILGLLLSYYTRYHK